MYIIITLLFIFSVYSQCYSGTLDSFMQKSYNFRLYDDYNTSCYQLINNYGDIFCLSLYQYSVLLSYIQKYQYCVLEYYQLNTSRSQVCNQKASYGFFSRQSIPGCSYITEDISILFNCSIKTGVLCATCIAGVVTAYAQINPALAYLASVTCGIPSCYSCIGVNGTLLGDKFVKESYHY